MSNKAVLGALGDCGENKLSDKTTIKQKQYNIEDITSKHNKNNINKEKIQNQKQNNIKTYNCCVFQAIINQLFKGNSKPMNFKK